ncbi:MAG: HAD-IA family hydrolase [Gammaproteobacteria bacterium]
MRIEQHPAWPVSHVIFDMDGLLLDTEVLYTRATQDFVDRYGKVFDWTVKSRMIGRPALESAQILVEALDLPIAPEHYLQERDAMLTALFPHADPMPGAERLIRHLHQHNVPVALASSSGHRLFQLKTRRHRHWFELFDAIVLGDDPAVKHGKPAPDIFLEAAHRIAAQPARCLVFEDAPSGLSAARAAGMAVAVVPDPHMDKTLYQDAHEILDSLIDFEPQRWGLPPFRDQPAGA